MSLAVESAVLLVAVGMIVWSWIQMSGPVATSPWLMPLMLGIAMALVTSALIVGDLRQRRAGAAPATDNNGVRPSLARVAAWLALATGYALVTPRVGFEIATFVFLVLALRFYSRASWLVTGAIAAAMSVIVPLIFRYVFFTLVP